MKDLESVEQFESRKVDHIRVAMDPLAQSSGSGFDEFLFTHEALPEIDFADVSITSQIFSGTTFTRELQSPFFVSSMTAGHAGSSRLNEKLASVAESKGWAMGVGSQRRELFDQQAAVEWKNIRAKCPNVTFFGNIGLSQLIHTDVAVVRKLADSLEATAMIVHLNPLQEALQIEGTPRFRGGLSAIENLVVKLGLPVVVKETGCGISGMTAKKLIEVGVHAIDVAGRGGTHWGRIEGLRAFDTDSLLAGSAATFRDWGLSTVESLSQVRSVIDSVLGPQDAKPEAWASGGIRSGLDGAKALALGASAVGVAQPLMAAALEGEAQLRRLMDRFEYELKVVLFCQGAQNLLELKTRGGLARVVRGGAV